MLPKQIYRQLRGECINDFERRCRIYKNYAVEPEDEERIKDVVNCATDFLDKYAKLSAGAMDDYEVNEFYHQTVKMLERAIDTKKEQYERARDELDEIEDMLKDEEAEVCDTSSELYDEHACEDVREKLDAVKSARRQLEIAEKGDIPVMEARLRACKIAENRTQKVLCIDSVANMVHTRGSILPLMCGAPLSEFVEEAIYGEDVETTEDPVSVVAVDMARDVMDALTCIKNFKPH